MDSVAIDVPQYWLRFWKGLEHLKINEWVRSYAFSKAVLFSDRTEEDTSNISSVTNVIETLNQKWEWGIWIPSKSMYPDTNFNF